MARTFNPFSPEFQMFSKQGNITPQAGMLMGIAQGLLGAGGWQPRPVTFGEAIGGGMQAGLSGYNTAMAAKRAEDARILEEGLQRAQIAKMERDAAAGAKPQTKLAKLAADFEAGYITPAQYDAAVAEETGGGDDWMAGSGVTAQMFNTYEDVMNRLRTGEDVSERDYIRATMAHRNLTAPRTSFDSQSGQMVTTRQNYPPLPPRPGTAPLTPVTVESAQETAVTQAGQPVAAEQSVTTQGGTTMTRTQVGKPKVSKEDAQVIVNARTALDDLNVAKSKLFTNVGPGGELTQDSEVDLSAATSGALGIPRTEGRTGRQAIRRSVEILLRMRTGAAAPAAEVDTYAELYAPSPWDTDEGARMKMARLESLFRETLDLVQQGRFAYQGGDVEGTAEDLVIPGYQQAGQSSRRRRRYNPETGALE